MKLKFPKKFNHSFIKSKIKNLKIRELSKKVLLSDEIGNEASIIPKNKSLRKMIYSFQTNFAYNPPKNFKGSCLDGRDITYNILPDADLKFYITANVKIRALRRFKELKKLEPNIKLKDVKKALKIRNFLDTKRKHSPLLKHRNSVEIDTGKLNKREMLKKMSTNVEKILIKKYGN